MGPDTLLFQVCIPLYQFYQIVYPSRRNDGVTKQYTLGMWLNVYYALKFAAHLFDQNMFYSQMAHLAHNRVLSTSTEYQVHQNLLYIGIGHITLGH